MSFLFGWFWSNKAVGQDEAEKAATMQRELFQEMKEVFEECELQEWSERRYDYDHVVHELTEILDRVEHSYEGLEVSDGHIVFPDDVTRVRVHRLAEEYLDAVVRNKDFVYDHDVLKNAVARKIMSYVEFEEFHFDWHYWQLFRRNLAEDLENKDAALEAIEQYPDNLSSEDSWDSDEE